MSGEKITVVCNDLSHQPFGRAALLAEVLALRYKVEIVGITEKSGLWAPWASTHIPIRSVEVSTGGRLFPGFVKALHRLKNLIDADAVYAVKTRVPSLLPALLAKKKARIPVVVDIDDWESSLYTSFRLRDQSKRELLRDPESLLYTRWAEKAVKRVDGVTVVSSFLRDYFGRGVLLPHGRNTDVLDPKLFSKSENRKRLGWDDYRIAVYLGTPTRRAFDVETVAAAVGSVSDPRFRLAVIGAGTGSTVIRNLKEKIGDKLVVEETVPFSRMPEYLTAADVVLLPSPDVPTMKANIPAKLFDAMALGCPIVATAVSDIPSILQECGWLVPPGDPVRMAAALDKALGDRNRAGEMGAKARERCIEKYGYPKMLETLMNVFEPLIGSSSRSAREHAQ
ncbi:MAG TPA: glycosyltransferase family 4 protein [bacterium]|nr:glycosyltransferase family 4 protein [bacterium]HPJ71253.1 glycosyltransferase family 4 protein [bacterium]